MPDTYELEERTTTPVAKKSTSGNRSWKSRIPYIVLGFLVVGLLAALIAVSVLYVQQGEELQTLKNVTTVAPTPAPGTGPSVTDSSAPTVDLVTATNPSVTLDPGAVTDPTGVTATGNLVSSTLSPGTTQAPIAPIYRLPQQVVPHHYDLELQVFLPFDELEESDADAFTTKGIMKITISAMETDVTVIVFHARMDNKSSGKIFFGKDDVVLTRDGGIQVVVIDVTFQLPQDIVFVRLNESLVKDQRYFLRIGFTGVVANDNQGLYRSSFMKDGKRRWLATSQFQPHKARRVFPCFDEPGFRATFSITVQHDSRFTTTRSNGNGVVVETSPPGPSGKIWTKTQFSQTPKMPSYLVAFLISDFGIKTAQVPHNGTNYPFNVIWNHELNGENDGDFPLQEGVAMIQKLDVDFLQPYFNQLPKLDMAGVPDFNAGAMENWGLVLYRESSLMYRVGVSSADNKRAISAIIGHELAHMIFGNLVTCQWWSETWLNEGFARFFQYELMYSTRSTWALEPLFSHWVTREALQLDSYDVAHPLTDPRVETLSQIDTMFDTITYAKGASILQMVKGIMGNNAFYSALRKYVDKFKLGNVIHADLFQFLSDESIPPGNVKENFALRLDNWVTKNGYPVLTLTRNLATNTITFKQQRFLFASTTNASQSVADTVWHIPLTLGYSRTMKQATAKKCWLTVATGDLDAICGKGNLDWPTGSWFIANVQQYGFYRVNYDVDNWNSLITILKTAPTNIPEENRGQIIDDAFNLAKSASHEVAYSIALQTTEYLNSEAEYGPMATGFDNLRYVDQMLRGKTLEYGSMQSSLQIRLLGKLYLNSLWDDQGIWNEQEAEANTNNYKGVMRQNLVLENACYYEVPDCLRYAKTRYDQWKANGYLFNTVPASASFEIPRIANNKNTMLCYGIQQSNESEWRSLFALHNASETTNSIKLTIFRALACTKNDSLIHQLLEYALDPAIVRPQDSNSIFAYVVKFVSGESAAWDFLRIRANWSKVNRKSNAIADVTAGFKTAERLQELETFFAELAMGNPDSVPEKSAFLRAIEKVKANVQWRTDNFATVVSYFQTNQS